MIIQINQSQYAVCQTNVANIWANQFISASPSDLTVWDVSGYKCSQPSNINQYWNELIELCIALSIPIPIELSQSELNKLHTLFPNNRANQHWHRVNLLIHWLEYSISSKPPTCYYDFNHSTNKLAYNRNKLPVDVVRTHNLLANHIYLGYTQIGRSFDELLDVWDLICPHNHFVPQTMFNACCFIPLTDIPLDVGAAKRYYKARHNFWHQPFGEIIKTAGYVCVAVPVVDTPMISTSMPTKWQAIF